MISLAIARVCRDLCSGMLTPEEHIIAWELVNRAHEIQLKEWDMEDQLTKFHSEIVGKRLNGHAQPET